jgi:hypothetical protein
MQKQNVATGIDRLKRIIAINNHIKFSFDPNDTLHEYVIESVDENGIKTKNANFFKWENINFPEDGLLISYTTKNSKNDGYFYFKLSKEEREKYTYNNNTEKIADIKDAFDDYEENLSENKKTKNMNLKNFISKEVRKLHLENNLKNINKKLEILKEEDNSDSEPKPYESNTYENYKKDLEEVVSSLREVCDNLESAALKQEQYIKTLPELDNRLEEGRQYKQTILDIFKEVKSIKISTERKLYEIE